MATVRVNVDRTDKGLVLQPQYEDRVGYGAGYGYGADYKSRGPSTNQVFLCSLVFFFSFLMIIHSNI